jgi:alanyl-tRNA synthetase
MNENLEKVEKRNFSTNEIRESWIRIFKERGYDFLPASSLIPEDDNSLLWINSGIATLKKHFKDLSAEKPKNFVNCQRVMRTDDLANINENSYHQTLFEMLGCFSIGSNFKKETIDII